MYVNGRSWWRNTQTTPINACTAIELLGGWTKSMVSVPPRDKILVNRKSGLLTNEDQQGFVALKKSLKERITKRLEPRKTPSSRINRMVENRSRSHKRSRAPSPNLIPGTHETTGKGPPPNHTSVPEDPLLLPDMQPDHDRSFVLRGYCVTRTIDP